RPAPSSAPRAARGRGSSSRRPASRSPPRRPAAGRWAPRRGRAASPPARTRGAPRPPPPAPRARATRPWRPPPPRRARRPRVARRVRGIALAARLAWRAGGTRAVLDALPAAALPIAFAFFIRRNNPGLSAATAAMVARLGAGLGAAALVALAANGLLARRTPW